MSKGAEGIYAFCYEHNRQIITNPDEEKTGAPCCDGKCEVCDRSWGDED